MSTSQAIRERIASQVAGEPFTPALFAGLGSRAAIDQALMRLTRAGGIERIRMVEALARYEQSELAHA